MYVIETALFDLIGYGLVLLPVSYLAILLVVAIGTLVWSLLWHFIDEGDSPASTSILDGLLKVIATKVTRGLKIVDKGNYCLLVRPDGKIYDFSDATWCGNIYNGSRRSREFIEDYLKKHKGSHLCRLSDGDIGETSDVTLTKTALALMGCLPLGLGFMYIPTITLVLGSTILSLFSMRWARRGVKKVKSLKAQFDTHVADKGAHGPDEDGL